MTTTQVFSSARVSDLLDAEALLAYLETGTPILVTPMLLDDVIDPSRTGCVPASYVIDGTWIWTETVA